MFGHRAISPYKTHHQSILHGPGIVTVNESHDALVAVVSADSMSIVHGLAFRKDAILRIPDRPAFAPQKKQDEVGLLGRMGAVMIGYFGCSNHVADSPPIKTGNLLADQEPIFENGVELSSNIVFLRVFEIESSGRPAPQELECSC